MGGGGGQSIELNLRFSIKPTSGSMYLEKAKHDNNEVVQINS